MAQSESVILPKRIPLVLRPENRDETSLKDAKLINCYVEKDKETGEHWVFKRPGLRQYGSTKSGNGYGVYNWLGDIYEIFGDTLYKNGTSVAAPLNTANGVYRFSSCKGTTPRLQLGNGLTAYNYDSGGGLVPIAGANFPAPFVKGWSYLDGTTYVMDFDASIRGCDSLNAPDLWTDILNRIDAQIEPDGGIALGKQLVYVVAFKQWTTEIFYDAANPSASPLSPVQGAKINYGCANADSVQDIDGTLFWLGTNRGAAPQVIMLEGLKASIVSTKPIERLFGEADLTDIMSFGIKYEGHRFYGLTLRSKNITLVYDMTENLWAQWTDTNGDYFPIVSNNFLSGATGGRILQHETNGKSYLFDSTYTSDAGDVITADLYIPNFDGGTRRRKQLNNLEFIGDRVTGSTLLVRCNDNDYDANSWSNFRRVDMSMERPMLTNCGTFRRRAYHIRHESNTPMRLQAMEAQIDLGTL
jgi:hypothetical protein